MDERVRAQGGSLSEETRRHLAEVRRALLRLHKLLLDDERARYEQAHGRVTSGAMLQLVINDEQFAWLRSLSELVVRVDELLEAEEAAEQDARDILAYTRKLLTPSASGDSFARKYDEALQREAAAVLAHRDVTRLLPQADATKVDEERRV
jgi:phage terminase small subunit